MLLYILFEQCGTWQKADWILVPHSTTFSCPMRAPALGRLVGL